MARTGARQAEQNFEAYNRTGLAGYVVCGSTGEANFLTWEETERLFAAVAANTGKGKAAGCRHGLDSLAETIFRSKRAAQLGYHAVLVRTPHYYKPFMTPAALLDYYRRVADASPVPVLVYSIPQFTGVDVSADLAAKLAQHPNILGIKESSGRLAVIGEIISAAPAEFPDARRLRIHHRAFAQAGRNGSDSRARVHSSRSLRANLRSCAQGRRKEGRSASGDARAHRQKMRQRDGSCRREVRDGLHGHVSAASTRSSTLAFGREAEAGNPGSARQRSKRLPRAEFLRKSLFSAA